jgi:hypothetical protein
MAYYRLLQVTGLPFALCFALISLLLLLHYFDMDFFIFLSTIGVELLSPFVVNLLLLLLLLRLAFFHSHGCYVIFSEGLTFLLSNVWVMRDWYGFHMVLKWTKWWLTCREYNFCIYNSIGFPLFTFFALLSLLLLHYSNTKQKIYTIRVEPLSPFAIRDLAPPLVASIRFRVFTFS